MKKATKVEPPVDMDAHNAHKDDEEVTPPKASVALLTTAQAAEQIGTDPRTLRKFLRSKTSGVEPVGQGRRYALSAQSLPKLTTKFEAWRLRDAAERAAKAEARAEEIADEAAQIAVEEDDSPVEELSYTADELEGMTVPQLRDLASEYLIDVPAKAKKAQIIAALTA